MRRGLIVLAIVVASGASGTAHASRTFYGWLYGTEVLPERGAELATWISEENEKPGESNARETDWWFAPLIGITDQLELALPFQMTWSDDDQTGPRSTMDRYGIEARYRLVTQDPVEAPSLVPLIRIGVKRLIDDNQRGTVNPEADFVVSYQSGRFHALADLGGYSEIRLGRLAPNQKTTHFEVHPGAGVSIQAVGDLRLGAEVFASVTLDDGASWAAVGPNLAWSHGRFWLSAAYGIGFYGIRDAPRVQWGIAF